MIQLPIISIPRAKSGINWKQDRVSVMMMRESKGWIEYLSCVRVQIPNLRMYTENNEIKSWNCSTMHLLSPLSIYARPHSTDNQYIRSWSHGLMLGCRSGQITDIGPASIFVFGDYWCESQPCYIAANDQDSVVCWDCRIVTKSQNEFIVFEF